MCGVLSVPLMMSLLRRRRAADRRRSVDTHIVEVSACTSAVLTRALASAMRFGGIDGHGRETYCVDGLWLEAVLASLIQPLVAVLPVGAADAQFLFILGANASSTLPDDGRHATHEHTRVYGYVSNIDACGGVAAAPGAGRAPFALSAGDVAAASRVDATSDTAAVRASRSWCDLIAQSNDDAVARWARGTAVLRDQLREDGSVDVGADGQEWRAAAVSESWIGYGRVAWLDVDAGPADWGVLLHDGGYKRHVDYAQRLGARGPFRCVCRAAAARNVRALLVV